MNKPSLTAFLAAHLIAIRSALAGVPGAAEAYDAAFNAELIRCQQREDDQQLETLNLD